MDRVILRYIENRLETHKSYSMSGKLTTNEKAKLRRRGIIAEWANDCYIYRRVEDEQNTI